MEKYNIELTKLTERLGLTALREEWHVEWETSCLLLPKEGLEFLNKEAIICANAVLNLPDRAVSALCESASFIRGNGDWTKLLWHVCRLLFRDNGHPAPSSNPFPGGETLNGMAIPMLVLGGLETLVVRYRNKGIPFSVMVDTLDDFRLWMEKHEHEHGRWGLEDDWLINHVSFRLFRLGRLQYRLERMPKGILDHLSDEKYNFYGDYVLGIHIQERSKLDEEKCRRSIREAERFFINYFPEWRTKMFVCNSWLLDPQLEKLLPENSNIIRFQRLFTYFFVGGGDQMDTIKRIFGWRGMDLRTASHNTTLQRAVSDYLLQGHTLQNGGGYILMGQLQ